MEFKNISVTLKTRNLLQLPLNQNLRQIKIDPTKYIISKSYTTLICYKIYLIQEKKEIFAYLFKNIHPTSIWYDMRIRDGDRLITLNEQDVTQISYENIYSIIIEKNIPFTCQVIWHPELYIQFGTSEIKNIDQEKDDSNISQRLIGTNMYEQITHIFRHLFDYQPRTSNKLFKQREISNTNQIDSYLFAQKQFSLLSNHSTIESNPEEIMKNIFELNILFEQIGIGLNKDEIFWIWILMKGLLNEKPTIQKLRFWGKIFGIKNNYYIVEADSEFASYSETFLIEEENDLNEKIFYVSTGIDQPFIQLPMITFAQIESSQRIQQFFTGDLEASIVSNSNFPDVEKHLLRAQIQRISTSTQIAPRDYYKISNTEDEQIGEESVLANKLNKNNEFQGNTLEDLAKSNGQYWIHYHKEENNSYSLSSINKDTLINELYSAWSIGISSTVVPEHGLISVRSNRWPGAFTVGDRYRFENIYIGWGMKNSLENQQANMINIFPETEYEFELFEIDDPTIEEENQLFKSSILFSPDDDEQFDIDLKKF